VKQRGLFSGLRGLVPAALAVIIMVCVCGCSVKPQPYSEGQMLTLALTDQRALMEGIPPLAADGRLSLEEAILRALVFNLDHRLALSENVSAERDRVLAAVAMLPELTASGNFYDRDNINASSLHVLPHA